jgi:hypothetical protein
MLAIRSMKISDQLWVCYFNPWSIGFIRGILSMHDGMPLTFSNGESLVRGKIDRDRVTDRDGVDG